MVKLVTETFFLPPEFDQQAWSVPSQIYNRYRSLLSKSVSGHVFVPIRSMQFLAVMDKDEIVFVDSLSYAVSGNEGGRLIVIAWKFDGKHDRAALTDPVPCKIVYYNRKAQDMQLRLVQDFRIALEQLDQYYREEGMPVKGAKILELHKL